MNEFDIPIFQQSYELYKTLHSYRTLVPRQDRYTLFRRCENTLLDFLEMILQASSQSKQAKLPALQQASSKLNLLRVLIRLLKDIKAIDNKKYLALQTHIDDIGRQLGGWIKSVLA